MTEIEPDGTTFRLRLFIAGTAPRSRQTVETVRRFCATHLDGRHELEVVDIFQQPALTERDGILAAPTLLKLSPRPAKRMTGTLDEGRLLHDLLAASAEEDHS